MADRALLHLGQIDAFAEWAATKGFKREPAPDVYVVLRLRSPRGVVCQFYTRAGAREHASLPDGLGRRLVLRWMKERRVP